MVTPIVLAVALSATGAGIAAYGQYQQGKQAERNANAQAAWHGYNAKVALREKEAQDKANQFAAQQQKKRSDMMMGRLRAGVGASGVEMEGSPLLVAEDTAAELAKEEMNLRLTGERKSRALKSRSILDTSKASAARSAADSFGRGAIWSAAGTGISGGAKAASMGNQAQK